MTKTSVAIAEETTALPVIGKYSGIKAIQINFNFGNTTNVEAVSVEAAKKLIAQLQAAVAKHEQTK